jgi:tetratricopeptide (TPR) repeat protein
MTPATPSASPYARRDWIAALGLAIVTLAVYWPALNCEFVNLDDSSYVQFNPNVKEGLTVHGVNWAFSTFYQANWHPLTWLSLQLDATLWKNNANLDPRGFHLTNVLLHAANGAILLLLLRSLTGAFWQSLSVAVLFALHPLRVESVAWVTERKDVLSAFFGLLALWAYAHYARRPTLQRYLVMVVAFVLSLLAKPMLVTLPCLLLVLDWWPLQRVKVTKDWQWLAVEKLPLFGFSFLSSVVTFFAQREGGAVRDLAGFALSLRIENAVISYVTYLSKTFWPLDLAVFYPHPAYAYDGGSGLSFEAVGGAVLVLIVITAAAVRLRTRAPYLMTGWLWYLGTLIPVIGLVQVGLQGYADRYTYLPQIGVLIAICWGVADMARARPRLALATAGGCALACTLLTARQLQFWQNSDALWKHAYTVSGNCPTVLVNLGEVCERAGDNDKAFEYFSRAVKFDANSAQIHLDLGNALVRQNRNDDAIKEFELVCELAPRSPYGFTNLANILWKRGKLADAKALFEKARALAEDLPESFLNLGLIEEALKDFPAAAENLQRALELKHNDYPRARVALGSVLVRMGQDEKGFALLEESVKARANDVESHYRLAEALAERGNFDGAIAHFDRSVHLDAKLGPAWSGLGICLARKGRDADALECLSRAVALNPRSLQSTLDRLAALNRPDLAAKLADRFRSNSADASGAARSSAP